MRIMETEFSGVDIVEFFSATDDRGKFLKPWVSGFLNERFGEVSETYFSESKSGAIRGLHYQKGEFAQKKFVICLSGKIRDIALDIRPQSPTYGEIFQMTLESNEARGIIIPEGFAHGIYAYENSIVANFCDKPYQPDMESGYNVNSFLELSNLDIRYFSDKDRALPCWGA